MSSANNIATISFPTLPLELCKMIYHSVMFPEQPSAKPKPLDFTALLERSLGEHAEFTALRRLGFQLFGSHQSSAGEGNTYIELMTKCLGLTQLCMKFEVENMMIGSNKRKEGFAMPRKTMWVSHRPRISELDDVVAKYRLADLFELQGLELIVEAWSEVRVSERYCMQDVLVNCSPFMKRLAKWLREGFAMKGRRGATIQYVEASTPGLRWTKRG